MRVFLQFSLAALLLGGGWCAAQPVDDTVQADGNGRILALRCEDSLEDFFSDVAFALPEWKSTASLLPWFVESVRYERQFGVKRWTGTLKIEPGKTCIYEQTITEKNGQIIIEFWATAQTNINLAAVVLFIRLPVSTFAGGTGEISSNGVFVSASNMPVEQGSRPHFLFGHADRILFTGSTRNIDLEIFCDKPRYFVVQDERTWNAPTYSMYTELHHGPLAAGQKIGVNLKMRLTGKADHTPASVMLSPAQIRYRFGGMGGNFVFGLNSPVAGYCLDNLKLVWARAQMNLWNWEPENDNDSPADTNWDKLKASDKPGSDLHRDFLMAAELGKRKIPYISSIWYMPDWLYSDSGRDKEAFGRRIAPDKWEEFMECMTSYLQYAKKQYGTEPALVSFNEPREGVHVLMTPEEHSDAIARMGVRLEQLGFKTKMLLGDVATARDSQDYVVPATANESASKYIGAISTHTWGGATPEQYTAWADLAGRIKKPFLLTEVGTDPYAWHTPDYIQSFVYAMRDLRMYQEVLAHARPYSILPWQLTSDYATVATRKMADGTTRFMPSLRFWFIKHFANLTPANADAIGTRSDKDGVLANAFQALEGDFRTYVVHVANFGGAREVSVLGLPASIKTLEQVVTCEDERYAKGNDIKVKEGSASFSAKGMSLTTLSAKVKIR